MKKNSLSTVYFVPIIVSRGYFNLPLFGLKTFSFIYIRVRVRIILLASDYEPPHNVGRTSNQTENQ